MKTQSLLSKRRHIFAGVMLAAIALSVLGACGGGSSADEDELRDRVTALESEAADKDAQIQERDAQIVEIQSHVGEIREQLTERDAALTDLRRQADAEPPEPQSAFRGIPDPDRFVVQIEADRLLLVEMRKELPDERAEAVSFWDNIKTLSATSNSSLVAKANLVIAALPAYFNFRETGFSSQQEAILTFQLTGAADYEAASDEFWRAFALSLIDRLDIVTNNLEQ